MRGRDYDSDSAAKDEEKRIVCVLDASTYVGFWVLKKLLAKGYTVHAALQTHGEKDIRKKIVNLEETEKRLETYTVDTMDYHSIYNAVKGCCALFCCLDNAEGYYDDTSVDLEIMSVINVVEACAQTDTIEKVIFNSSLTAAVWRENTSTDSQKNVDERSWSDPDFCRKNKLWYALTKTLSEKAAWALANDRMLNMVSINAALAVGPSVGQLNSHVTYLQGAAQMYEGGVLAFTDVKFLADVHIQAFEDPSTSGRYLCFKETVNTEEEEAYKFAQSLSPLISLPIRYKCENGDASYIGRLQRNKLNKLVEGAAFI